MHSIVLPILEANMTHGTVRAWLKQEGDPVEAGEVLFEVETDKVNAQVEAEASGILRRIVAPVGTRVPVLGLLAFVGTADEAVPDPETWSVPPPCRETVDFRTSASFETPPEEGGSSGRTAEVSRFDTSTARVEEAPSFQGPSRSPRSSSSTHAHGAGQRQFGSVAASPAARRLARERGVALAHLRGTGPRGEISRADVEAAAGAVAPSGSGEIDPAFLERLRRDTAAIRALSSETKVDLYRHHGARIGDGVRIEPGAIIIAGHITIGTAVTIGADSSIECDRLQLGRLVSFGKRTRAHCRSIDIGDALWSKDDVVIGGGGSDEVGARLHTGAACFFGEGAYLNTCHPLTLGDEVCIGSRAMLFTHSHWQSVLRGYPSLFAPISVGDHVFIGNNAFVFPGVTIASGATVMVNSFVALNVPPNTLVGGVPAQVIRHVVAPPRAEQVAIVRDRLWPELAAVLGERGYAVNARSGDALQLELGDSAVVHFLPSWAMQDSLPRARRAVILCFAEAVPSDVPPGVTLFDLAESRVVGVQDDLSDDVRELCRRRGIRFRPFAWRYRVGHFEGDRFVPRGRS